ncbi:MAG TPA: arabinose isomerase [Clostridia bacterium]|nr:arabinose isomerase [Clostridia bacterium]
MDTTRNAITLPKLGVLALMLEAYEPIFSGITERQTAYVKEVLASLADTAEFRFDALALNRGDIERMTAAYNREALDGILILLCSYSQGQYLVRAMQQNRLPLALALIQPDETVGDDFEELELTVNQGIHGSQDNANALLRAGIPCAYYAGSRFDGKLRAFVADFSAAARTVQRMKTMRIGIIGKLAGMGDVVTDDMAFFRKLGPEFIYDSIGTVTKYVEQVSQHEIEERVALERELFDVDPAMPPERHAYAVRLYLGLKRYVEENGYAGYTAHFEEFGADGRYLQLPLLAASNLLAEGYGYAAEGDASCAAMVASLGTLCGIANFSEMYMMDLKRDAILLCHAGEGNWKTCRKDKKPFLMDRVFNEGGLSNPPTPIFAPDAGRASLVSIVHLGGERFRLVVSHGTLPEQPVLRKIDMPYIFFQPDSGAATLAQRWLEAGGTHHETVVYGDYRARLKLFARLLDVEYMEL